MNYGLDELKSNSTNKNAKLNASLGVSVIVNTALACELIIKSMLPQKSKNHNHKNLFEKLDYDIHEKVKNLTVKGIQKINNLYTIEDFNRDLEQNKLNFNKWRYFHEGISHEANFLFIDSFMNALFEIAKVERGK